MRIVHLTQSTTAEITGGVEHHVDYLAAALRQLGHEIIVVGTTSLTRDEPSGKAVSLEVRARWFTILPPFLRHSLDALHETVAMFVRRLFRFRHARQIARHVAELQPDLIHEHSYIGELRTCQLLLRKYPLVFTNHTGAYLHLDRWTPTRWLQRQWMKCFAAVIAPSRELLPATNNSWYVPNGVDTTKFYPASVEERAVLKEKHLYAGKRVFLCARRWAPTKGILYLAKALHHLPASVRSQSVFLFAGNETPGYTRYQENVRQTLAASGCEFHVLGNLNHAALAEQIHLADLCIFPSLMEATSLACLESMACAVPVLGTRTGGLLELIQEDVTGWLVQPRDEKSLAVQIEHVFRSPSENLKQAGRRAAEFVRESYTWEAVAHQTDAVYRQALRRWASQHCAGLPTITGWETD